MIFFLQALNFYCKAYPDWLWSAYKKTTALLCTYS